MKPRLVISMVLIALLVGAGAAVAIQQLRSTDSTPSTQTSPVANVVVVKPGGIQHIRPRATRAGRVVLSSSASTTVHSGTILASGVTRATPNGLLRRVTSVHRSPNRVVLQTAPVPLTEVVPQGSFQVSKRLDPHTIRSKTLAPGVSYHDPILPVVNLPSFTITLSGGDGRQLDVSCSPGYQVAVAGSITLAPSVDFSASWAPGAGLVAKVSGTTVESSDVSVTASVAGTCSKDVELARFNLQPFDVQVGPIPVVITPVIRVVLHLSGTLSASLHASGSQQATITVGLAYDHGAVSPIHSFSNSFKADPVTVDPSSADVKASLGPALDLLIYGGAGPTVTLNGYLRMETHPAGNPWWTLHGGAEGDASLSLDLLNGAVHADVSIGSVSADQVIATADGPLHPSPPPSSPPPSPPPSTPPPPPPSASPSPSSSPDEVAQALFQAWEHGDRAAALEVATSQVVDQVFQIQYSPSDEAQGLVWLDPCAPAQGNKYSCRALFGSANAGALIVAPAGSTYEVVDVQLGE